MTIVIAGGGWAGCAAALSARKAGMEVILLERTDTLLGTGLVGGIMRNNGRFTAAEECIAMGGGELFHTTDTYARHENVDFPGHCHASLYDIAKTPGAVSRLLEDMGICVKYLSRVVKADMDSDTIRQVTTEDDKVYAGDVFMDATGTAGPVANCTKYGNGCAMCVVRCPSFGGRVSLSALVKAKEMDGQKEDGTPGAMSGACKLMKDSLAPDIAKTLDEKGVVVVPIPKELTDDHISIKACQQYALPEYQTSLVLLDTGHAKLMSPYFDLNKLRGIPGFENARYEDPYAGSKGNSMRFFSMVQRDDAMKVQGVHNLFCAGEKAGLLVGHTEAIVTGTLAGYNAARFAKEESLLILPRTLAIGEAIAYVREQMQKPYGMQKKYTFSGSVFFERMQNLDLYSVDVPAIRRRVEHAGLFNVFSANR